MFRSDFYFSIEMTLVEQLLNLGCHFDQLITR